MLRRLHLFPAGIACALHAALLLPALSGAGAASAAPALAPVEARVPFAPSPFNGSDGARHLAYELHISNFYGDTGALAPQGLEVRADTSASPLLQLDAAALSAWARPAAAEGAPLSIAAGKRLTLFIWLSLPADAPLPHVLSHHIDFTTDKGATVSLDGAAVTVAAQSPPQLGPPLKGGRWLAHEGPGAAQSHHWGSLVAVNGALTIPQRFALDLVGVDAQGRAVHAAPERLQHTRHQDWVGYAAPVIAVAHGVVRDARDGEPEHAPLTAQPEPTSLTEAGLFGNYVVLEIAPGVFASYAHLRKGSIKVRPGQTVQRGQALAELGQSGNSAAPHLHFQLSNSVHFEGSEGIPYVFDRFQYFGPESEAQLFGQGPAWNSPSPQPRRQQLPLNDVVIGF